MYEITTATGYSGLVKVIKAINDNKYKIITMTEGSDRSYTIIYRR